VNLAAVPSELSETVLFGHERGAFTGALRASRGFCRAAEKGTLFLDEIGESSVSLQAKLLRFLQSAEVQPVGSEEVTVVDARIVTATNRDLAAAIRDKQFREDLFYRLNIVQIRVPPLRERRDDISPLIDLFLEELNARYARCCRITDSAAELLKSFAWPGNVRQLRGVIETLVVLAESDAIGVSDLPVELRVEAGDHSPEEVTPPLEPATVLERMTTLMIRDMLEQERGNVSRAAHRLGISRATLYRRLKKVRRHGNAD
jgi:transcriptional regulator with PAS, ATPase and Fis domain